MFFSRSNDTVLGEASDDQEVFMLDDCEDIKYDVVMYKIKVIYYIDRCDLLRFLDEINPCNSHIFTCYFYHGIHCNRNYFYTHIGVLVYNVCHHDVQYTKYR